MESKEDRRMATQSSGHAPNSKYRFRSFEAKALEGEGEHCPPPPSNMPAPSATFGVSSGKQSHTVWAISVGPLCRAFNQKPAATAMAQGTIAGKLEIATS